jgi:hypothetical protein
LNEVLSERRSSEGLRDVLESGAFGEGGVKKKIPMA